MQVDSLPLVDTAKCVPYFSPPNKAKSQLTIPLIEMLISFLGACFQP